MQSRLCSEIILPRYGRAHKEQCSPQQMIWPELKWTYIWHPPFVFSQTDRHACSKQNCVWIWGGSLCASWSLLLTVGLQQIEVCVHWQSPWQWKPMHRHILILTETEHKHGLNLNFCLEKILLTLQVYNCLRSHIYRLFHWLQSH